MSTSSLLSPLCHFEHLSSSPVCSGTFGEVCLGRGLEPGCTVPVHFMVLIVTVSLRHRGLWVPSLFNPLSNASNRPLRRALRNIQLPPYPSLTLPTFVLTHTNNIQSEGPVPFHARPPLALQTQIQNLSQAPPTRPPLATNKHPDCEDRPRLGPVLRLVLASAQRALPCSSLRPSTPRSGRCRSTRSERI